MSGGLSRNGELQALSALCRELAKHQLDVGMSDARPAVSVRATSTGHRVWVSVSTSGEAFVWKRDDDDSYPADDPVGAATYIADHIKSRDAE